MAQVSVVDTIDKLLLLQEQDCRMVRGLQELSSIPTEKSQKQSRIKQQHDSLESADEAVKQKQGALHNREVEIQGLTEQIKKLREQQFQIKSNQEFRVLTREIEKIQQNIKSLEDQELELMEELEDGKAEAGKAKDEMEKAEAGLNRDISVLEQRRQQLESEIEQMKKERETLNVGIDQVWLKRYDLVFDNRKDVALVPVENGLCSACHMKLPPQVVNDVKKAEAIISCNFCGRILYWPR